MEEKPTDRVHIRPLNRAVARGPRMTAAVVVRTAAAVAALVTVAAGLGVRSVAGGEVAKYAGDALYTVLIYALVLVVAARVRPLTAAVTASAVSWAVELAQLTGVPEDLSRQSTVARLVLGSTFNAPDLFWYLVGAALAWGVHSRVSAAYAPRPPRTVPSR